MNSKAKRIIKLRARDIKNTLKQEQTIKELRDQLTSVYEDIIELMSNEMGGIDKRTLEAEALNWIKR